MTGTWIGNPVPAEGGISRFEQKPALFQKNGLIDKRKKKQIRNLYPMILIQIPSHIHHGFQ